MKKTAIGIVVAAALLVTASLALAWGPGYGRGYGVGPGYGYPAIPNLTVEQSSKIQSLQKAYLDETAPLQQQLLAKRTELVASG